MNLSSPQNLSGAAIRQRYMDNLDGLRAQGLKILLVTTSLAAYAAALRYFYYFQDRQAGLLVGLVGGLALAIPVRKRYPNLAVWALLAGAWVAGVLETLAYPGGQVCFGFVLVIAAACLALSERPLWVMGLLSAGFLLWMALQSGGGWGVYGLPLVICAAAALVLSLAIRLLLSSLQQATAFVHLAEEAMDEARADRGKLVQVVKALDEGNYRLQKAYQKIALARDEANQAREMKIHFANMISHELRAPLNFIIGVTDFMVRSPDLYGKASWPPELHEDVTRIYQSSKHLSHLIDDVLTLGQIEANRMALSFESSSIVDVLENVLVIIRPSYEHRGLYLHTEIGPDIPPLLLDRVRIRQVLLNLLNNAYRFIKTGGVTIRIECIGPEVQVSVEDTGVGIPEDQVGSLFQEFFQADTPTLTKSGGSGLGLSISRQFIELHGGHIWVESPARAARNGQDPGTRFSFTLPIRSVSPTPVNEESERRSRSIQSQQARDSRTVILFTELAVDDLLPDDFPNFCLAVLDDLEQLDYQIQVLQPYAFVELSAREESLLSERTRALLDREAIPYVHCLVTQEDTGVVPLWDEYVMKPFTMARVNAIVDEICPGASCYMVVDDDENMLRYFELGLTSAGRAGVRLLQAETAEEARRILDKERPDILFLDINLPDANGLLFLEQMKMDPRLKALPVVIISAHRKPYLYRTRVRQVHYYPARMLDRERFIYELDCFLNAIRVTLET